MISQVVDPPERLFDEAQALAEKIANIRNVDINLREATLDDSVEKV